MTYLGITSSRGGDQLHQLLIALDIAKEGAIILRCNPFNNYQSSIYFNSHFMPKLTYLFTFVYFTFNQYDNIKSIIIPSAIAKLGFNRTRPLALRYGSHHFGGLGLRTLETEALIKKIHTIPSLMEKPESSRLLLIVFQLSQHIYGESYPLLDTDKPFINYGNIIWINHFIKMLRKHKV